MPNTLNFDKHGKLSHSKKEVPTVFAMTEWALQHSMEKLSYILKIIIIIY